MNTLLSPGVFVRHPVEKNWGVGEVQSVAGKRVTVNFPDAGKRVINANIIELEIVALDRESLNGE